MRFDKRVTNVCKGAAVLLLLWHHLWCVTPEIMRGEVFVASAIKSKICVAIFVLLSGFGLSRSQGDGYARMLRVRLPRLLCGYWLVAFSFISIGIAFFGMSFKTAYPGWRILLFPLQLLGLNVVEPTGGFNPTWWFMNAIVPLYLLAPLLLKGVHRFPITMLCACLSVCNAPIVFANWLAPFVLGMVAAQKRTFERVEASRGGLVALVVAVAAVIFRERWSFELDAFIAYSVVLAVFYLSRFGWISRPLAFLGGHSMNIFLLHTFILFWARTWFGQRNPFVALVALLSICLACSYIILGLKHVLDIFVKRCTRQVFDRSEGVLNYE